jgi:hypothetical protein
LGVSRATVGEIASGRRGLHGRDEGDEMASAPAGRVRPARCGRCGYRVYSPCRVCIAREFRRERLSGVEPQEKRAKRRRRSSGADSRAD